MLSFAAVGFHGREWQTRIAAFLLVLAAADTAFSQTPPVEASLAVRTLIARREPMLDVVELADRLVVLGPESIGFYPRAEALNGAAATASLHITHTRPWPRDLRGRLRMTAAGFDALLPGVVCRGALQPLTVSCADEIESWPLGLDNSGIMPSRNFFATPEGLAFFGAAPIASSGDPRWLIADGTGTLAFLDASRTVVKRGEPADDVVRLADTCAPGTYVVTAAPAAEPAGHDELRLVRVVDGALTRTSALSMPGAVVALWAQPGGRAATAIVHPPGGSRYEALSITLACVR